jgi:hypothetical protein
MEQTTLQERIEERAEKRLRKDLRKATDLQSEIRNIVGTSYSKLLDASDYYDSFNNKTTIRLNNDFTKDVFDALLPKYIQIVTDEILEKIDQIDYLLKNPHVEAEDI